MTTVSILYDRSQGSRFDFDYYINKHMALAIELLGGHPGYKSVRVEKGSRGMPPQNEANHVAMCHFEFTSADDFLAAFAPHAERLLADVPNYTDIPLQMQFNETILKRD